MRWLVILIGALVAGSSVFLFTQLQSELDHAYEHWRTTYKYLVKCQTDDRPVLGRLSGRLTPALVGLRTMISQSTTEQTAQRPVRR